MESFFEIYEAYFYGIGFIILGIGCLAYMRYRDLIEEGNNPSLDRVLQLVKITGIFCIVLGVYLIWRFR